MNDIFDVSSYFDCLSQIAKRLSFETMDRIVNVLLDAYHFERMIYLFGNGGSAALASHFACDLSKGTIHRNGKRFRVLALTDSVPLITAWANDSSYENIF